MTNGVGWINKRTEWVWVVVNTFYVVRIDDKWGSLRRRLRGTSDKTKNQTSRFRWSKALGISCFFPGALPLTSNL